MSQPPGEPRPTSDPTADETKRPAEPATGAARPPADASNGPATAGRSPGTDATASDTTGSDTTASDTTASDTAGSDATIGDAGEQPWWTRGQMSRPPGPKPPSGQTPLPYQQSAPWAYQQPAPPTRPGWGPPPATRTPADSADSAAGRDRLVVHLFYEAGLALIAVVLIIVVAATTRQQVLTNAFAQAGYLGLMATGLAFSMRTASPNLAVGLITYFSSTLTASLVTAHGWGKPAAFLVAILLCTLIGLVLGLVVALLSVPSWAASLGAVVVIQAIVLALAKNPFMVLRFSGGYPTAMWYSLFFVLSAGGGALWLIPALRQALSGGREPGDQARWRGLRTGVGAVAGLTVSSFLAGLAAVPLLMRVQLSPSSSTTDVTFALAAVLLGGVSVFGRRAGVFGTLLAVTILTLIQTLILYHGAPLWVQSLVVGLAAILGVAVSRGLETVTDTLNRTRPAAPPPVIPRWPVRPSAAQRPLIPRRRASAARLAPVSKSPRGL